MNTVHSPHRSLVLTVNVCGQGKPIVTLTPDQVHAVIRVTYSLMKIDVSSFVRSFSAITLHPAPAPGEKHTPLFSPRHAATRDAIDEVRCDCE